MCIRDSGDTVHATGNYAYGAAHACGPRYQMLGDAYAFVDPVFSSGVYLAMASAGLIAIVSRKNSFSGWSRVFR